MTSHEPLRGGTLNQVSRVGPTVRRPAGPWTPLVHDLLRHVRAEGFTLAPEPLGFDEQGREVLTFVEGRTVGWDIPWPAWMLGDDMLGQVGAALASYHQAVAGFRPRGTRPWRSGPAELGPDEIVCHHDLAPYNVVERDGVLAGVIDWDLAGPGRPRSDLAFVAWQWVPLHGPTVASALGWRPGVDRAARLRLLLDAYGLAERRGFMAAVAQRIEANRALMLARAAAGDRAYRQLVEQGHVAGMEAALAFVGSDGSRLQEAIEAG